MPKTGMSLSVNNGTGLSHHTCQRVLEKTGNEAFANLDPFKNRVAYGPGKEKTARWKRQANDRAKSPK